MKKLLLMLGSLSALALGACSEDKPAPAPAPPARKAAAAAADKSAGDKSAVAYVYSYNPTGKRDPFRSPVDDTRASAGVINPVCNEPLCQFDLDQLTLVAVVTGDAN